MLLAVVGPTAGRWYAGVTSGVTPKHFIRGEWFFGIAFLTGKIFVGLYSLIVQQAGWSISVAILIAFAIGCQWRMVASTGLAGATRKEPAGIYKPDHRRPLLGRKI